MATQATENIGTYLYGVISHRAAKQTFHAAPVACARDNGGIRLVGEGDLVAVVSDAPLKDCDPSRANLKAHQRVIEEVMEHNELLPVRFGTIAMSDADIKQFLRDKHDDLARSLERVKGRAELSLKVMWNQQRLLNEILREDEEIRALRESIADQPDEVTRDQRIDLGRMVAEAMSEKQQAEADRILERLRPLAVDVAVNKAVSEDMVLNAGFLVERSAMKAFDDEVTKLGKEENGRLQLRYTGPLPPYDFVNIVVRKKAN